MSTVDNLFSINMLFELFRMKKKKLYCMFVDFEKAFENVWRKALWRKLLYYNINGKMYDIINNTYDKIKSRIVYNHEFSNFLN